MARVCVNDREEGQTKEWEEEKEKDREIKIKEEEDSLEEVNIIIFQLKRFQSSVKEDRTKKEKKKTFEKSISFIYHMRVLNTLFLSSLPSSQLLL